MRCVITDTDHAPGDEIYTLIATACFHHGLALFCAGLTEWTCVVDDDTLQMRTIDIHDSSGHLSWESTDAADGTPSFQLHNRYPVSLVDMQEFRCAAGWQFACCIAVVY